MNQAFTESIVEQAALAWLESPGYGVVPGVQIAPGEPAAERADYSAVVLARRLRDALAQLNRDLPSEALEGASCKLTLAALRNALLPKPLSGEIRGKGAEKSVEKHTWAN